MRISTVVGFLASMLPLTAQSAEFVQDQSHFEAAIRNESLEPFFVYVTIVDDRSGESRTGCVEGSFLKGAIHKELDLSYDPASIERVAQIALSNSAHVFHFSNPKALNNVPFRYIEEELEQVRGLVRDMGLHGLFDAVRAQDPKLGKLLWSPALACVFVENGLTAGVEELSGEIDIGR